MSATAFAALAWISIFPSWTTIRSMRNCKYAFVIGLSFEMKMSLMRSWNRLMAASLVASAGGGVGLVSLESWLSSSARLT
jgi:hypothetical protein